jgi:hypothetical protein
MNGYNSQWLPWINQSDSTCPPFGVLTVTDLKFDPSDRPTLHGQQPGDDLSQIGFAFNGRLPVEPQQPGECTLWTPALAAIDTSRERVPTFARTWGPKSGSWLLWAGRPGYQVIGKPHKDRATGDRALVTAWQPMYAVGKTAEDIDKNATGTVDIYRLPSTAAETNSSAVSAEETVEVYNRFGDITSGKWCLAVNIGLRWEMITGECD